MSVEKLRVLSLNPHFYGKIIQSFMGGYKEPVDIKLIFYILPIILYRDSRNKLSKANSRSSLESLFSKNIILHSNNDVKLSGKVNLAGFKERFDECKKPTKQALIILNNEQKIKLNAYVKLVVKEEYNSYKDNTYSILRAAYYLGIIFSKTSKEFIDSFLGVVSND